VQQLLGLALQHPPHGDPRPGRDDLGDVGLGDLVGDHARGVGVGFLRVDELLFDDGDLPVQQLRGTPQVAGAGSQAGAVKVGGERVASRDFKLARGFSGIVQAGKRRIVKVVLV